MERRQFLAGVSATAAIAGICAAPQPGIGMPATLPGATSPGERLSLDYGWRFWPGDVPFPEILTADQAYDNAKAGNATGAAATNFDDSQWSTVELPHDFALEQAYDPAANRAQGYRPRGVGWYRRTLALDPMDKGKHLELGFDGIATHATVWINGNLVHRNFSGYTSFHIDITPFATFGEDLNTIVVRADATAMEGWWYEGAGIYRHVWLVKRAPTHIATDGLYAAPEKLADGSWRVWIEAEIANPDGPGGDVELDVILFDSAGRPAGMSSVTAALAGGNGTVARTSLSLPAPQLWSVEEPALYRARAELRRAGTTIDVAETRFGFRTAQFDADRGFLLNGRPVKIKGVCLHQDHAGVGVAVPDALWEYRLRRIKAMGANAIRCSHNAPASELLDAADRLGVLVMDENRNFNVSEDYLPQLSWMVRRDRNHPSIILWSVFNEESTQGTEAGVKMVRRMVQAVKALDRTRPVTAAMNGSMFTAANVSQVVDVVGFNYQQENYDRFHAENPRLPMTSSEDTSAYMTRGERLTDRARHAIGCYDDPADSDGRSQRTSWKMIAERPFVAGGFVWTGFDYRGEPAPFDWPTASSSFGLMDLCGFPKASCHMREAMWRTDAPVLHISPHWTWPGLEGQPIKVMVLTNAEEAALLLNGKLISRRRVDPFDMVSWDVPYAPGRLEAVAFRGGKAVAHTRLETTGMPVRLRLTPDRPMLDGDGRDAQPIMVEALDAAGRPVPTAAAMVRFEVEGGRIIGLGNGDANSHEPDKGNRRSLYNGLAQVIVQTDRGGSGLLRVRASAAGLEPAAAVIAIRPAAAPPFAAPSPSVQRLDDWRTSPPTDSKPDPTRPVTEVDLKDWGWTSPGASQAPLSGGRYVLFRTRFRPRRDVRERGGKLVFGSLAGRAEIWLDDHRIHAKTDPAAARLAFDLPPGEHQYRLVVLFDAPPQSGRFGLAQAVKLHAE